ncbi:MAG: DUF1549 domain-containing protein, partial [Planctomycetota bacterium]|nr:DUF1549 domain-containing protein [Planctomycetota bacterium]
MTRPNQNKPERDDVADLMKDAFACDPMREEFATALKAMLQSEFANRYSGGSVPTGSMASANLIARSVRRRPMLHRLFFGSLIASVVLGVFLLSGSRSNYTWASMLQALEARPWIQATGETESGGQNSGWISFVHRIVAHRSPQRTELVDHLQQVHDRYEPSENVIHRESLTSSSPKTAGDMFVEILLRELPGRDVPSVPSTDATGATGVGSLKVLSESWRRVPGEQEDLVELTVRVRYSDREFQLEFRVDPKTQLPISCRVNDLGGATVASYQMNYPHEGPREVAELGVPKSASVVSVVSTVSTEPSVALATIQPSTNAILPPSLQVPSTPPPSIQSEASGEIEVNGDIEAQSLQDTIDEILVELWQKNGATIAPPADDHEFLRRIYLDLAGRIPTVTEIQSYVGDGENRRENLVSQLLEDSDCASHLASVWRKMLMPPDVDLGRLGGTENFERWLAERFRNNVPYDQLVRDLLLAEGRIGEAGPLLFYAAVQLEPERLAGQTSRAFLGIRMECAQCHDHKLDARITQQDFWGYAAFFGRIS